MTLLEERLAQAGTERADAEYRRGVTAGHLRVLVRKAAAEGWPKTRIAEVAGISRQTVHEMLKEDKQPLEPHHPVGLGGDNLRAMTREDHERLK